MTEDIRWKQRLHNFNNALKTLTEASALAQQRPLTQLEMQGLIQGFEFTHELAWNMLKDYLESKGYSGLIGSRDATRTAFKNELIADGEVWMDMIKDRNQTTHTYNLKVAERIAQDILQRFYPAFMALANTFASLENGSHDH
jgi:nucleotidyltransferase substrate binding protein (TIGR01987 family)